VKPYDANAKCPKCNHNVISTRFIGGIAGIDDALHRKCARCDFGWKETPLDKLSNTDRAQLEKMAAVAGSTRFAHSGD
jgi:hypothetical protein